jgi:hypothetical protein
MAPEADTVADPATTTEPSATTTAPAAEAPTTPPPAAAKDDELPRERVLEIENERLRRELAIHVAEKIRTREIVDEIDRTDRLYEAAKEDAKGHKEDREEAKARLRALVKGDVQVVVDFAKPDDGKQAPGPTVPARTFNEVAGKHRAVAGTYGCWQFALTRDLLDKVDVAALRQTEAEYAKRKVGSVEVLGSQPYLPLEQQVFSDGSGYFVLWPLLDTDAWDGTCAEKYAHALKDLGEEAPDITARRRTGGEFCGVMVKCGRRKFVVGPDDQAIRLVYAPDGVKGGDGGYLASQFLSADAAKHAEVLSFPAKQLPDRIEARLREYAKASNGYHEGLAMALAGDLKVDVGDVVAAAKADTFRFDVYLGAAGSESQEIVRLLLKDAPDGAKTDAAQAAEG